MDTMFIVLQKEILSGLAVFKLLIIRGYLAHSDGDVLLHAICDALLGAAKLRDIGFHFPDTSSDYKNIDSKILLDSSYKKIKEKGYYIVNLDATVARTTPKTDEAISRRWKKSFPVSWKSLLRM